MLTLVLREWISKISSLLPRIPIQASILSVYTQFLNPFTPTGTPVSQTNFILTLKSSHSKHNFAYPKSEESLLSQMILGK